MENFGRRLLIKAMDEQWILPFFVPTQRRSSASDRSAKSECLSLCVGEQFCQELPAVTIF